MKHLKTFDINSLYKPKFKNGDYVKCVDEIETIENDGIYIVKYSYNSDLGNKYIVLENNPSRSYFTDRFILATSEEIERYKIKKQTDKYNL